MNMRGHDPHKRDRAVQLTVFVNLLKQSANNHDVPGKHLPIKG